MTKRTLIGAFAIALALIVAGCPSSQNNNTDVTKPLVSITTINGGGTLHVTWAEVPNATSYELTAGASVDTTDSTHFDFTTPVESVKVIAMNSSKRSDAATVICSKVVSSTVSFYNYISDTTHENGFGFDTSGNAVAYKYDADGKPQLDFVSTTFGSTTMLQKSGTTATKVGDQLKAATGSYDSLTIADSVFTGSYHESDSLFADSAYVLRMSANDSMWTAGDHYAKMRVDSIVGTKVSVTITYQTVNGIRWLK